MAMDRPQDDPIMRKLRQLTADLEAASQLASDRRLALGERIGDHDARIEACEHRTQSLLERCRQAEAANRALSAQLQYLAGRVDQLEAGRARSRARHQ